MFSNSFLFVIGIGCLGSVILTLPTTTDDLLHKLPPELAEILFGEDYGQDVWNSLFNGDLGEIESPDPTDPTDPADPADPGRFNPEARLFQNLFNLSSILANAPNNTASITFAPLGAILASIFNLTNVG